ncbi:MAG TPA: glycosyl hydrolase, partial [Actinoplanes sp.]
LSVSEVVSLWPALTGDASIAVGSPATSADTAGQQWFTDFMTQVESQKLRVDFVAVHWYGWNAGSCDAGAAEFEKYLNWVQGKAGGRPLWITEFGCLNASNPDEATVQAFYTGAVKMFARHSQVERYAWYPWITNNHLVADDGALTALGTTFAQQASTR